MLFPPPSVLAAVALVPAFEAAASPIAVSPVVDRVGGLENAVVPGGFCSSCDAWMDSLLPAGELNRDLDTDGGVEKDRSPSVTGCSRLDDG